MFDTSSFAFVTEVFRALQTVTNTQHRSEKLNQNVPHR